MIEAAIAAIPLGGAFGAAFTVVKALRVGWIPFSRRYDPAGEGAIWRECQPVAYFALLIVYLMLATLMLFVAVMLFSAGFG